MMFKSMATDVAEERSFRLRNKNSRLTFGVEFLDASLEAIFPDDLILLGAYSGAGKTQLCLQIAMANVANGKRVHYIALEAGQHELNQRVKFNFMMNSFFADPNRPRLKGLRFSAWLAGRFMQELLPYELKAEAAMAKDLGNLSILYKHDTFTVTDLITHVTFCAEETDLILIDHVHYFDFDDTNENRAIKEIAKTVRTLALTFQKPIILVAHLRKRDKGNTQMAPGLDEFHGSSDLFKIATRVVTLAAGEMTSNNTYETFFRVCKNRFDGAVTKFLGRELFNPSRGKYETNAYKLGWANSTKWAQLGQAYYPEWAVYRD